MPPRPVPPAPGGTPDQWTGASGSGGSRTRGVARPHTVASPGGAGSARDDALRPAGPFRRRRRTTKLTRRQALIGYLLLAPITAVLVGLLAYPLVDALLMSLHARYIGFDTSPFVGLDNYAELISDSAYWTALKNTVFFAAVAVVLKLVLGMLTAVLLNRKFRGRGLARSVVLIPWALPTVVTVLVWSWMYNDAYGVINQVLSFLHLPTPHSWLGDQATAMWSVIAVDVWRGFPFFALIILAGLQSIPADQYEVAAVDGAGRWRQFRYVSWPGIATVTMVATLLSTIWSLNEFPLIWVLTQGGPGDATTVLSVFTFKTAFLGNNLGYGVAVSATLLPVVVLLILALVRATNKREGRT